MQLSEHFGITLTSADDWFDPDLSVDTQLFVDPFFVLREPSTDSLWNGAHDEFVQHFARCYELLATGPPAQSPRRRAALSLLLFPEPREFCLGYTSQGTRGSGSGGRYANLMAGGISIALAAGLERPAHVEEIGILTEGIGADRISDAICNVLKHRFVRYTKEVVARHGVPTQRHQIQNASCDLTAGRWMPATVSLPTNPFTGDPVLLVPRRFLNRLPVLNPDDWFDSSLNEDVRRDMNVRVSSEVRKKDIVKVARRHPDRIRAWASQVAASGDPVAYDFEGDPLGVVRWHEAEKYAEQHPLPDTPIPTSHAELEEFVSKVVEQFRHYVEHEGGWRLLWNDDETEKREEAAQLLLLGVARPYCRSHNIELDREVQLGRGPVDFKLSSGASLRLLLEMKKLHNGEFWNGLEAQLVSYMESDQCRSGWLLALRYRSEGVSETRSRELPRRVHALSKRLERTVNYSVVDARPKASASKLTPGGGD